MSNNRKTHRRKRTVVELILFSALAILLVVVTANARGTEKVSEVASGSVQEEPVLENVEKKEDNKFIQPEPKVTAKSNVVKSESVTTPKPVVKEEKKDLPTPVVKEVKPRQSSDVQRVQPKPTPNTQKTTKPKPEVVVTRSDPPKTDSSKPTYEILTTGYNAGLASTGKTIGDAAYGITKSGVKVSRGKVSTVAADTRVFPIGTVLHIEGYGLAVVADIGGAIKGMKIDLYFDASDSWIIQNWGRKYVTATLIKKGDGTLTQEEFNSMQ
jgi:3D (Asp-Asp-Asp) domain-containing protein